VAATESPIVFLGTGEHFEDLETFEAGSFVKRLLGLGDLTGLLKTMNEAVS
jgi:signal recognition particle subunit SRP54